jgi:hypothetical protein
MSPYLSFVEQFQRFILLFSYMNTKQNHHIHPHSPFPYAPPPLVPTPGKEFIDNPKGFQACIDHALIKLTLFHYFLFLYHHALLIFISLWYIT